MKTRTTRNEIEEIHETQKERVRGLDSESEATRPCRVAARVTVPPGQDLFLFVSSSTKVQRKFNGQDSSYDLRARARGSLLLQLFNNAIVN